MLARCRLASLFFGLAAAAIPANAANLAAPPRPPRPWVGTQFQPLTAERIAALPAAERSAWQAYWDASEQILAKLPSRPVPDASSLRPLPGPPKGGVHSKGLRLDAPREWYASPAAADIADRIVAWQSAAGAWKKGIDYNVPPPRPAAESGAWITGTFDNNATISELRFLAHAISAASAPSREERWRASFERGVRYIFLAQYPNGGFPQIYPLAGGYHDGVTFNDNAMTQALEVLRDVAQGRAEYAFVPTELRLAAAVRFHRGLQCVLATQLRDAQGRRTAWCQQYDPLTLQPAAARNFEPIADAAQESAALALVLMSVPEPSPEIVDAVQGVAAWFQRTALRDLKWVRSPPDNRGEVLPSPGAPLLWARFYEPGTTTPIFGDRDRTIHYALEEISPERRAGYSWFGTWPAEALARYEVWQKQFKP